MPSICFVHTEHEPMVMEGGTVFNFVTDGTESALKQARQLQISIEVAIAGGARCRPIGTSA